MINLIEVLFGIAVATALGVILALVMKRRPAARRLAIIAAVTGVLAGALEVYVRYRQ